MRKKKKKTIQVHTDRLKAQTAQLLTTLYSVNRDDIAYYRSYGIAIQMHCTWHLVNHLNSRRNQQAVIRSLPEPGVCTPMSLQSVLKCKC